MTLALGYRLKEYGIALTAENSNPEFDKLIEEEQRSGDQKKRVALLQQAERILMTRREDS